MVEYTIDDIRGPTVAREMAQLKEFVLAQFNNAIADAEAAAAQAATDAANAVLSSIDSRVGALEGDMTTAQGDIVANANAILALDGSVVKLAGAQTITGIKNVPLEATGTSSNQIASSQKVKNELDNYAPMVRTTGNQTKDGTLQLNNIGKGTVALATNININARVLKLARASGFGIYRYGGAFFLVMCRDVLYLVRLTSGSGATLHNATVTNLSTLTVVADLTTLPFALGYYIDGDGNIYVTIKGTSGNKLATVYWFGGSQGGTSGLAVFPVVNDEVSETVTYFWEV